MFFSDNLRVLGGGRGRGVPAAVRMARGGRRQPRLLLCGGDGLQLPPVPILRHHYHTEHPSRRVLRSHLSCCPQTGTNSIRVEGQPLISSYTVAKYIRYLHKYIHI